MNRCCKNCGWFFEVKGNRKVFCSKECSKEYFSHRGHKPRKRNGGKNGGTT